MKTKGDKNKIIDSLADKLSKYNNFYITDVSDLKAEENSKLRRLCFNKKVTLQIVKNTLLKKALEKSNIELGNIDDVLKGNTSLMFSESGNVPAKIIKAFRKDIGKPIIKAAYIEKEIYFGDQLEMFISIKTKNELVGEIIHLLQSPAKNVISALQSGRTKISGIVKTLASK